ncbi:MAG TPA: peptidylprolyl isomerase, partial [Candidatus Thermoplasmatota archaeon]|nr:peptidylprolyl isomerase [Candidatus Thermoplasmatota archaeon]
MRRPTMVAVLVCAVALAGCAGDGGAAPERCVPGVDGLDGVLVRFDTTLGAFTVCTAARHAPSTVRNFLEYVDTGYYVGLTFHRVSPGFVVQGGGFEADYETRHAERPPIRLEATPRQPNVKWSLSMARTSDPHSATSEFFINLEDNTNLDPTGPNTGYAVFAHVVEGFGTIEAMTKVEPGPSFSAGGFY